MCDEIILKPIGVVHSCFQEKFGTPRQPGLVVSSTGIIEIFSDYAHPEAFKGLEEFSHLWVLFHFNQTAEQGWKPKVRPPRLGGNKYVGVFATRSMFRPNPIGLSVVKLGYIEHQKGVCHLHISGQDIIDKTPVLDIKPYIPYVDSITDADGGFASCKPQRLYQVNFRDEIKELSVELDESIINLIADTLCYDPRPQYQAGASDNNRIYGFNISGYNVRWVVISEDTIEVISVEQLKKGQ